MRCPLCGLENLPYAEYCDCGYRLREISKQNMTNDFSSNEVPDSYFASNEGRNIFSKAFYAIEKSIRILKGNYSKDAKKKARRLLIYGIAMGLLILAMIFLIMFTRQE